ncbi:MAG TPA: ROK family protein, partial [Chloroflexota bacterium]|nr:ROK family protein [Chloroflexota bacterium]
EARAAVTTAAKYLAAGIANVVTLLRPERVVIGGGAASASRLLIASLRDMVARRAALVDAETYEIVAAELGPVAGAIGAALWSAEIDSGMCMDDVNDIPVSNVTRFGTLKG